MSSINKCIIVGNLCSDPEVRAFQNGGRVCNMNVATNESWKDKATGERKERVEFHRVTITNEGLVGIAERFLRKGSKVYLEGQLQTRKYQDKNDNDAYTTEVVLKGFSSQMVMLSKRDEVSQDDGSFYQAPEEVSGGNKPSNIDDEIPF